MKEFCGEDDAKKYKKIRTDVLIGKNKNLKWCCRPDCENVVRRSRCPCKNKVMCQCSQAMCFACGKSWHGGTCATGVDKGYAAYMLLATCPNCQAPVEKNGACNHMACRCGNTFCWICRADITRNYNHGRITKPSWHLGCSRLVGDTAFWQGLYMTIEILLLPLVAAFEA